MLADAFPWCAEWHDDLRRLFAAYVAAKQRQGVLDYDDLLLWWERMLRVPEIAADAGGRFDHVLVDEYQDTNALQAAILQALKPDGRGVTVVGDDAQAIYSFRGATVRNILDFPGLFAPPATRAAAGAQLPLRAADPGRGQRGDRRSRPSGTPRSWPRPAAPPGSRPVLALVRDEAGPGRLRGRPVLENREAGMPLREQAVLFRAAHHSAALEVELARRGIPFVKYGGLRFLEAAHVKDVLALLRWAENPRDQVAAFRVLQLLPGVGPGTARKALAALEAAGYRLAALARFARRRPPPSIWPGLVEILSALAAAPWPVQLGLARRFYDPLLEELHDHPARAPGGPRPARAHRRGLALALAVPDRADAGPARGGRARGGAAAQGRGLAGAVDGALGQGAGVEGGLRAERGRRLHPLGPGDRDGRGGRGGAAAPVRGDDPGEGRAAPAPAGAVPRHRPGADGGPVRARAADAVRDGRDAGAVRRRAARGTRAGVAGAAPSLPAVDIAAGLRDLWA